MKPLNWDFITVPLHSPICCVIVIVLMSSTLTAMDINHKKSGEVVDFALESAYERGSVSRVKCRKGYEPRVCVCSNEGACYGSYIDMITSECTVKRSTSTNYELKAKVICRFSSKPTTNSIPNSIFVHSPKAPSPSVQCPAGFIMNACVANATVAQTSYKIAVNKGVCTMDQECAVGVNCSLQALCDILSCPTPPVILGADRTGSPYFRFGESVFYSCSQGYVLKGKRVMTCNSTINSTHVDWSGDFPNCTVLDCGSPEDIQSGNRNFNETIFGSYVIYSCDVGHVLQGESVIKCDNITVNTSSVILSGGRRINVTETRAFWSSPAPKCKVLTCEMPPSVDNGNVSYDNLDFGSSAVYSCHSGYFLQESHEVICNSTEVIQDANRGTLKIVAKWSSGPPTCIETTASTDVSSVFTSSVEQTTSSTTTLTTTPAVIETTTSLPQTLSINSTISTTTTLTSTVVATTSLTPAAAPQTTSVLSTLTSSNSPKQTTQITDTTPQTHLLLNSTMDAEIGENQTGSTTDSYQNQTTTFSSVVTTNLTDRFQLDYKEDEIDNNDEPSEAPGGAVFGTMYLAVISVIIGAMVVSDFPKLKRDTSRGFNNCKTAIFALVRRVKTNEM